MFSADVRQFRIKHILVGFLLVGLAMSLVMSESIVSFLWGELILIGIVGATLSYVMLFVSDTIDNRPIDDRKLSSRFFNMLGLVILIGTGVLFLLHSVYTLFHTGLWVLGG